MRPTELTNVPDWEVRRFGNWRTEAKRALDVEATVTIDGNHGRQETISDTRFNESHRLIPCTELAALLGPPANRQYAFGTRIDRTLRNRYAREQHEHSGDSDET